ncbi:MAG: amino acid adenylation domain-containing protein [Flexilinea sp.]
MITCNILEYFEKTVTEKPSKIAVIDGGRVICFGELLTEVKKLGSLIHNNCSGLIRKPLGVYLEKSIESVVADLAVIYSGNAYMNLDVKNPVLRIKNILDLIQPEIVITDAKHYNAVSELYPEEKIINISNIGTVDLSDKNEDAPYVTEKIIDTDPLCVINTSGSTGTPKGVVLNHRSFIDFTEWAISYTGISDDEIIGCLSPIVFDIYSFELCMLMAKSSTMVIIPESYSAFPAKILQLMVDKKISFIFWVPTIMVNIANMDLLERIPLSDLKMVWFAGEVFPTKQFNYWQKQLLQAKFINLYGPIEITLDCTYFIVDREIRDDEPIPIGYPCHNTDVLILNDANKPVGINEEGELCVRGSSLAMGYYNNPEKTAAAFVQNPLNNSYPEKIYRTGDIVFINGRGEIVFKGRKDSLVKHSGYRIELGEIEHVVINTLKLVKNGCVVYNKEHQEITLFYESDNEIIVGEIRKQIATELPKYMIPTVFIRIPELPRNANGKIDRLRLTELSNEL